MTRTLTFGTEKTRAIAALSGLADEIAKRYGVSKGSVCRWRRVFGGKRICPQCGVAIEGRRRDAKHCSLLCKGRDPKEVAYDKKYYQQHADDINKKTGAYYHRNKDKMKSDPQWVARQRTRDKNRRMANPAKINADRASRRAKKKHAMPPNLSDQDKENIKTIYQDARQETERTGVTHHVDHEIPLCHPDVCGLHVPWNLKIVPAAVNYKKNNKILFLWAA